MKWLSAKRSGENTVGGLTLNGLLNGYIETILGAHMRWCSTLDRLK